MPNVFRYSVDVLEENLKSLIEKGLTSLLIFGIVKDEEKDEYGTAAGGRGK